MTDEDFARATMLGLQTELQWCVNQGGYRLAHEITLPDPDFQARFTQLLEALG